MGGGLLARSWIGIFFYVFKCLSCGRSAEWCSSKILILPSCPTPLLSWVFTRFLCRVSSCWIVSSVKQRRTCLPKTSHVKTISLSLKLNYFRTVKKYLKHLYNESNSCSVPGHQCSWYDVYSVELVEANRTVLTLSLLYFHLLSVHKNENFNSIWNFRMVYCMEGQEEALSQGSSDWLSNSG